MPLVFVSATASSTPFVDEFEVADPDPTHFGSFRLVTNFTSTGVMQGLRVRLNWTVTAGASGYMAKYYSSIDTNRTIMLDIYGNKYQVRSSFRGWPLGANVTKGRPKMRFVVGLAGDEVTGQTSMSEVVDIFTGSSSSDPRCSTSTYLCCTVGNQYYRYTIKNSGVEMSAACTRPLLSYESGDTYALDYRHEMSLTTTSMGTTTHSTFPTFIHTTGTLSQTNLSTTLTVSMRDSDLNMLQEHPSRHSLCDRGVYFSSGTIWENFEPFLVPYTRFGNGIRLIGVESTTYAATRGCTVANPGAFLTLDENNTDQFWYWDKQQWFGYPLGTPGKFTCDWGYDFTPATSTSPVVIGLSCNQPSVTQSIVAEFNVLTQMFRPMYPIISLQRVAAFWDQRTHKIRVSVQLWASGEHSGNVTATVKSCSLYYDNGYVNVDPIPNTTISNVTGSLTPLSKRSHTRFINASCAERIHVFLKGIYLAANTPLGRQIGYCYVQVDIVGVSGTSKLFPQLENIKVPMVSFRSNATHLLHNRFDPANPLRWREVFKNPVEGGYTNIVPAQVHRRREHLRSRYKINPLQQSLSGAVLRQQRMDASMDAVRSTDPLPYPSIPPLFTIVANSTSLNATTYLNTSEARRTFTTFAVASLPTIPVGQVDPQAATISRYKQHRYNARNSNSSLVNSYFPTLSYDDTVVDLISDEPEGYSPNSNPVHFDDGTPRYADTGITYPDPTTATTTTTTTTTTPTTTTASTTTTAATTTTTTTTPSTTTSTTLTTTASTTTPTTTIINGTPGGNGDQGHVGAETDSSSSSGSSVFIAVGVLLIVVSIALVCVSVYYYIRKRQRRERVDRYLHFVHEFDKPTKRMLRERFGADYFGRDVDTNYPTNPPSPIERPKTEGNNDSVSPVQPPPEGRKKRRRRRRRSDSDGLPSDLDQDVVVVFPDEDLTSVTPQPYLANLFSTAQLDYFPQDIPPPPPTRNQHRPHRHYDPELEEEERLPTDEFFERPSPYQEPDSRQRHRRPSSARRDKSSSNTHRHSSRSHKE